MLVSTVFSTPLGSFEVVHNEHFIFSAAFTTKLSTSIDTTLARLIDSELTSYFANNQHRFQLPLKPHGSPYQQKVWNALLVIPVGRTLTYGELALSIQSSPRAVGQACKKNPLALFIPCHRVVGKTGLGGYMGNPAALPYKEALLAHESSIHL
ncbi:methylated-DNA--[protein]-cysteine S-methyltransferase [Legionella sp. km772]|uniref:methylated-DNA--[protein]-cysteine S-methyltransferase n=1 Tax=Legionella sp. km772 TaxID=2498111 RepID=UPI000F8C876A|nr:methylated-DNA--[protein]-cysteine S-methyltransferase [Legionella sp. km772]RUR07065.1 methylated-DNA--[protein]-cysteine S-methyltransferase [Legionella sp. km772]